MANKVSHSGIHEASVVILILLPLLLILLLFLPRCSVDVERDGQFVLFHPYSLVNKKRKVNL